MSYPFKMFPSWSKMLLETGYHASKYLRAKAGFSSRVTLVYLSDWLCDIFVEEKKNLKKAFNMQNLANRIDHPMATPDNKIDNASPLICLLR